MNNKNWFKFIEKGHLVKICPNQKIEFEIEGVLFELEYSNEWFRLYKISPCPYKMATCVKTMWGSDFHTLGRKDIHIMADDGINHLENARKE